MNESERRARRKQWNKIIDRWKREEIDRKSFRIGTLDDEKPHASTSTTLEQRLEALMKLRWLNYGPDSLYGRLERVLTFGKLPPSTIPRRRRNRS